MPLLSPIWQIVSFHRQKVRLLRFVTIVAPAVVEEVAPLAAAKEEVGKRLP